jgi:hypothetical protein
MSFSFPKTIADNNRSWKVPFFFPVVVINQISHIKPNTFMAGKDRKYPT